MHTVKVVFSHGFMAAILVISFFPSSNVWCGARRIIHKSERTVPQVGPRDLADKMLNVAGMCGQKEMAEVGRVIVDIVLPGKSLEESSYKGRSGEIVEKYNEGIPNYVWDKNYGALAYFEKLLGKYPDLQVDKMKLKEKIQEADKKFPLPQSFSRPKLSSHAQVNVFEMAMEITGGNVFRAVTLIGMLGHDDISNISSDSNLFARGSLGIEINPQVLSRYQKATEACLDTFIDSISRDKGRCAGAGGTFNYHLNFGFYLGCELAKKGFQMAMVSPLAMNLGRKLAAAAMVLEDKFKLDEPYIDDFLECANNRCIQKNKKGYEFDLCMDPPQLVDYLYKRTTMQKFLTWRESFLFNHGYNTPFMAGEKKFPSPANWPEGWNKELKDGWEDGWDDSIFDQEEFNKAVVNLDYRLMNLEYGAEQARRGAEAGAKLCREYKEKQRPGGLSTLASKLYDRGYWEKELSDSMLSRLDAEDRSSEEVLEKARTELSKALEGKRHLMDYYSETFEDHSTEGQLVEFFSKVQDQDVEVDIGKLEKDLLAKVDKKDWPSIYRALLQPLVLNEKNEALKSRHARVLGDFLEAFPDAFLPLLTDTLEKGTEEQKKVLDTLLSSFHPHTFTLILKNIPPKGNKSLGQCLDILGRVVGKWFERGFKQDSSAIIVKIMEGFQDLTPEIRLKIIPLLGRLAKEYALTDGGYSVMEKFAQNYSKLPSEEQRVLIDAILQSHQYEKEGPAMREALFEAWKSSEGDRQFELMEKLSYREGLTDKILEAFESRLNESTDPKELKIASHAISKNAETNSKASKAFSGILARIQRESDNKLRIALIEGVRGRPEKGDVFQEGVDFMFGILSNTREPKEVRIAAAGAARNGFHQYAIAERFMKLFKNSPEDSVYQEVFGGIMLDNASLASELVKMAEREPEGPTKNKLIDLNRRYVKESYHEKLLFELQKKP